MSFLQGQCAKVSSINDKSDWKVVRKALTVIDFTEDEVEVTVLLGTFLLPLHLPMLCHLFAAPSDHLVALMGFPAPPPPCSPACSLRTC
jgi:hypothetical protein